MGNEQDHLRLEWERKGSEQQRTLFELREKARMETAVQQQSFEELKNAHAEQVQELKIEQTNKLKEIKEQCQHFINEMAQRYTEETEALRAEGERNLANCVAQAEEKQEQYETTIEELEKKI